MGTIDLESQQIRRSKAKGCKKDSGLCKGKERTMPLNIPVDPRTSTTVNLPEVSHTTKQQMMHIEFGS